MAVFFGSKVFVVGKYPIATWAFLCKSYKRCKKSCDVSPTFYKENPANNRNQIDFYIFDKLVLLVEISFIQCFSDSVLGTKHQEH